MTKFQPSNRVTETLIGSGPIARGAVVVFENVGYEILIYQERVSNGAGGWIDCSRWMEGQVHVSGFDAHRLMNGGRVPLTLTVEDGRTLNFFVTSGAGRIARAGGGTL